MHTAEPREKVRGERKANPVCTQQDRGIMSSLAGEMD